MSYPLWKDVVAYLLVERPFNSNVKSNHREDQKNAVVPITAKFFEDVFNDTLEMVCLFLYVKKKTDNLKYCLIKMEVCRVGESAPVRKNMDDWQQEM